jgi:cyclopropane fatty-acyl-phospholipid synthase-like methyltransferase
MKIAPNDANPTDFYDEAYYLAGTKSGYGGSFHPYDESRLKDSRNIATEVKRNFDNTKTALDLGCARGYLVRALREIGIHTWGIDISKWAIENADKYAKPYVKQGDITTDLHLYKDQEFDSVFAYDVLEHIEKEKLDGIMKEICRITKKRFLLQVPVIDNGRDKSHVTIQRADWWLERFLRYDFEIGDYVILDAPDKLTNLLCIFRRK